MNFSLRTLALQMLLAFATLGFWVVPAAEAAEHGALNGEAPSTAELAGVPGPPVDIEPPLLGGPFIAGSTVSVSPGNWEGDPLTLVFQWLRCSKPLKGEADNCTPITKAVPPPTSLLYFVRDSDLFGRLAVEETATNAFGTTTVRSSLSAPVVAPTAELATHPPKRTANNHASFVFLSNVRNYKVEEEEVGIHFKCKVDQKPFVRCRSPFEADLKPGRHVFKVRAVGPGRARDRVGDEFRWWIS